MDETLCLFTFLNTIVRRKLRPPYRKKTLFYVKFKKINTALKISLFEWNEKISNVFFAKIAALLFLFSWIVGVE